MYLSSPENNDKLDFTQSDELSTTCSDIDSQPRTPGEALTQEDAANSTQYDEEEGVFKVPGEPPKTPNRTRADETISRRTRSKISLTATPLEAFESQCLDPDVSADNYDTYTDQDESWKEFLKEFQKPLSELTDNKRFPLVLTSSTSRRYSERGGGRDRPGVRGSGKGSRRCGGSRGHSDYQRRGA